MSLRTFLQFRQKTRAFLCLFLLIIVFQGYQVRAQTASYVWKNAPIGGGGFVTGIVTHKTSGDTYCRTDIGGAYRWDAANNKWIQLLDWLNESENGFTGVEALALDPQNANNVYMLCGIEYLNYGRTAILKSTDKGNTFTYTDVTAKFKCHGNGNGRGNGERLAVDPKNSNVLFCGTRANGLWKSTDAGVTWNLAWNGVTTTANNNGICFVLFDPSGSVVNGVSQTIYIGVSRTGSANIYKSTDGGTTFTDITANTSFFPHRAALQGTTMYVTYSDNEGPQSGTSNGVGKLYKLNTATGVWTNITPAPSNDNSYGGVSIDPTNVNRVIVSTCGLYWNHQFGTSWGDFVFLTIDGGLTWTLKNGPNATYDANGMGWSEGGGVNWMDCIEFDQSNLSKVRVVGGGGLYTCSDITAANPSWKFDVIGIEETAFLDGISIPGGPLISSFGDVTGFVHDPLTSSPTKKLAPSDQNNQSIAYAAANTNKLVRASNGGNVIYYSSDMGATWTGASTNMGSQGRVAISADGGNILHCPGGSTTTYYTTNNGAGWSGCSGVSVGDAIPVADQVNANYFYIFNPGNGQMLRSSDKGVSFSPAGTPGGSTSWEPVLIRTVPGLEGHIWVPLVGNGLKYSTDHGATYTTLSNVPYCKSVGIGKAVAGASYPTVFIWGTVSGVTGLFRSTDQGATWTRINDDAHQFAGAPLLIGDMNVAGRVYMSAGGGRGVIYWEDNNKKSANWKSAAYTGTGKGGAVKSGDVITYTIHVRNTGNIALDNVNVIDTVPAFTVFVSADGGITPDANGKLTWTITNIPVGSADITRSFIVKVASDLTGATNIINTAGIDNGNGKGNQPTSPPMTNDPGNPATNPTSGPSTSISVDKLNSWECWKTVVTASGNDKVKPDEELTYTIHIRNTGNVAVDLLLVTDPIPEHTSFVSAGNGGTLDPSTNIVTWNVAAIAVGATTEITMVVKAADNLDSISVIVNTASATDGTSTKPTSGCDPASPDCTGGTGTSISTIPGDAALVFANAMSPNGDGKNEYFIIKGLEKYPPASLFVFSRWGNMVYQSSAYNNNWDGAGLSEGTYYYKLVIAGADGKKTYTGWILLKRK